MLSVKNKESQNTKPLVSICIPTYNSAEFLREMLDSIVNQTYKNIEVIISDNASSDNTAEIAGEYAEKYDFSFSINEKNIGAGNNFNKLIDLAQGEYIAIYHADDIYKPAIIAESVRALNSDEKTGFVGTMANVIDDKGNYLYDYFLPPYLKTLEKSSYNFEELYFSIIKAKINSLAFVTPSIMIKRKVYETVGKFIVSDVYKSAGDYELWLRISRKFNFAVIDKKLMSYRIHPGQGSEHECRQNIDIPDIIAVLEKYKNYLTDNYIINQADMYINSTILGVAFKQNSFRHFDKSLESLKMVKYKRLKDPFYKLILYFANIFKIIVIKTR